MKRSLSAQEIQDYLDGLNRLQQSWTSSRESVMAKRKGLNNYVQWFKDHGITISEDPHSHVWGLNDTQEEGVLP